MTCPPPGPVEFVLVAATGATAINQAVVGDAPGRRQNDEPSTASSHAVRVYTRMCYSKDKTRSGIDDGGAGENGE